MAPLSDAPFAPLLECLNKLAMLIDEANNINDILLNITTINTILVTKENFLTQEQCTDITNNQTEIDNKRLKMQPAFTIYEELLAQMEILKQKINAPIHRR